MVATYVGCTRLTDYWHHYSDVLAGALLGIGCSFLSYFIYAPRLYPTIDFFRQSNQSQSLLLTLADNNDQYYLRAASSSPQKRSNMRLESRSVSESEMAKILPDSSSRSSLGNV